MFMWPQKDDPPEIAAVYAIWWGVAGATAAFVLLIFGYGLFVLLT